MAWDRLRTIYDTVASRYEETFLDELAGKPRDREILDAFAAAVSDPVLEVGCGPGQVGLFVKQRRRWVAGADLSGSMAGLAAGRLDAAVVADMRALPVASRSVGALLAFYCIIHIPRPQVPGVLGEFHRVLRPGGRLLLTAHEGAGELEREEFLGQRVPFVATFFGLDELASAVTAAGLQIVRAERRPAYPTESGTVRLFVEGIRA